MPSSAIGDRRVPVVALAPRFSECPRFTSQISRFHGTPNPRRPANLSSYFIAPWGPTLLVPMVRGRSFSRRRAQRGTSRHDTMFRAEYRGEIKEAVDALTPFFPAFVSGFPSFCRFSCWWHGRPRSKLQTTRKGNNHAVLPVNIEKYGEKLDLFGSETVGRDSVGKRHVRPAHAARAARAARGFPPRPGGAEGSACAQHRTAAPVVTINALSSSQVNLWWNAVPGATSYRVEEWIGSAWQQIANLASGPIPGYVASGLSANTTYSFEVARTPWPAPPGPAPRASPPPPLLPRSGSAWCPRRRSTCRGMPSPGPAIT